MAASSSSAQTPSGAGHDLRWLIAAGHATWLLCGVPPIVAMVQSRFAGWRATSWLACYLLFGAAFTWTSLRRATTDRDRDRVFRVSLLLVESVAGLMAVLLSGNGTSGALLVIVAAQIPHLLPISTAVIWIGIQAAVNAALVARYLHGAMGGLVIGGFQFFALASSVVAARERTARRKLAAAHQEVLATRAQLAESSRLEERLRIARDLHDTLGHHLTALSLQLDVASRLADGKAATHVSEAHAITRLLLSDVRDVVAQMREPRRVDLADALRTIASTSSDPAVHLTLPSSLELDDQLCEQALLRAVQEIITNAARHGAAANVWIEVALREDGIHLAGRDDGRGAETVTPGHGLMGMRERFEECGGRIEFSGSVGRGFEVQGFLPHPRTAS